MKYIIVFMIILLCTACIITDKIAGFGSEIEGFDKCYTGEINEIDKLCQVDGYYKGKHSQYLDKHWGWSIIFYKDGTCAANIESAVQRDIFQGEVLHSISNSILWGTYYIKNDIITTHSLDYNVQRQSGIYEYSFKVINDTTLWRISTKIVSSGRVRINDSLSDNYILPLKFIPLENKPDSSCRLKEKEWFWCDKEKYYEYMAKLKEEKRKKR